ncbi:hypothetical protein ACFY2R_15800 [Micromonospora olivasterospora]|uniref:SH3 domain-containing protein n=1 Tax=Micromonospora olivasterospora TaxID=1880 RepID=A0A562IGM0_MICOL|nr:hypothetical protein [Micromonospora olivasterospora]TWH70171.1 hypothetical protein JD77_05192 [Micromonospora olivasterospora]
MPAKKIAMTVALSALATTLIGAPAAPAAAGAAPAVAVPAASAAAHDAGVQTLHYVCANTLWLRTQPGGNVYIGQLVYGDYVDYQYSITGWSYVYAYRFQRYGWIQSGWLDPC